MASMPSAADPLNHLSRTSLHSRTQHLQRQRSALQLLLLHSAVHGQATTSRSPALCALHCHCPDALCPRSVRSSPASLGRSSAASASLSEPTTAARVSVGGVISSVSSSMTSIVSPTAAGQRRLDKLDPFPAAVSASASPYSSLLPSSPPPPHPPASSSSKAFPSAASSSASACAHKSDSVDERDGSHFMDSKRQKVDNQHSPLHPASSSSSSSRSASSSASRVIDADADAVFLPHMRSDGAMAFTLRGTTIQVNGDHLDDDDRLAPEHSHISMIIDDDDEDDEREVEGEEAEEEEEGDGDDGEGRNGGEEVEDGEEVEEEEEEDEESGDVDAGGVMEITLTALRRRLANGDVVVVDADPLAWLTGDHADDDGEDDEDYQPREEEEDDHDDRDGGEGEGGEVEDGKADEDDDEEEEEDEEEGNAAVVQAQEADGRAEFGRHPRPARWYGAWPIEGVPMTSPEHVDHAAMATFAQQTRTHSLYTDRYPVNTFTHARQRAAPPPNVPSTTPLSSAYLSASFVPTVTTQITEFDSRVFCGRFSASGEVYCAASQDGLIHLYETDNFQLFKRVEARDVGWSVIDVDIAHNQRFVIYSSWSESLQLVNIPPPPHSSSPSDFELHEALDLHPGFESCMFGIRFSPSDLEVLAGLNRGVMILYDIERRVNVFKAAAHTNDINSVAFLDEGGAGNIFASGSDDALIKVWDRRTQSCIGGWLGHVGGLTSVSACCDGQFVLSNSKDSSLKLWDMRCMNSRSDLASSSNDSALDYRWQRLNRQRFSRLDKDRSLCTYVGHSVEQTLIRCAFSPEVAGRRFVSSGSGDGCVCIWDAVTGELCARLGGHRTICREVSWDPRGNGTLMSASWDHKVRKWEYGEDDVHPWGDRC